MDDRACIHARKGQALVDIASADRRVTPNDIAGTAAFIDGLLRKLRMGNCRRRQFGALRRRLRLLRAMCRAADRFWNAT